MCWKNALSPTKVVSLARYLLPLLSPCEDGIEMKIYIHYIQARQNVHNLFQVEKKFQLLKKIVETQWAKEKNG